MTARTVTQSMETDAPPQMVLNILQIASGIPRWAPAFADLSLPQPDGSYIVTKGSSTFRLRVAVERSSGCVDYLREMGPGVEGGAYIRPFPRPQGGSVIVMTVPLGPTSDANTVSEELLSELGQLAELISITGG